MDDAEKPRGSGCRYVAQVARRAVARRRKQAAACLKRGLSRPKLVSPSTVNTPLDYNNVHKEFVAVVRRAELRHRSPHAMRHTFISLLLQKGASLAYVQKQAGHNSMDLTLN